MSSRRQGSAPSPARGEVWSVDFDPTVGHEEGGVRPALIVSDDQMNTGPADLVIVLPVTCTRRGIPAHVPVAVGEAGLTKPSVIMTDQVRTVSKQRLGKRWGRVDRATMGYVENCLRRILAL